MAFELPPLPYAYNALEPFIDEQTMTLHHDKHHAVYLTNLNNALKDQEALAAYSAEDLVRNLSELPESIRGVVRNHGGGYINHNLFWAIMGPNSSGAPAGALSAAINQAFGSFDDFKSRFNDAGLKQFGSGWVWLVLDASGKLAVTSTPNQDSPLTQGAFPIMGNDVWEHAYYLKYQNRRADYLAAWWNVLNWDAIAERYEQAIASR